MRKYSEEKPKNVFLQGFWLGLIFGTIGALVILSRRGPSGPTL